MTFSHALSKPLRMNPGFTANVLNSGSLLPGLKGG